MVIASIVLSIFELTVVSEATSNSCMSFVAAPLQSSLLAVERQEECWGQRGKELHDALLSGRYTAEQDDLALHYVASILPRLDGGEWEDAIELIGAATNRSPQAVLTLHADGSIHTNELLSAVTSLPNYYADDYYASAQALRTRLLIIERVFDPSVHEAKQVAENGLRAAIQGFVSLHARFGSIPFCNRPPYRRRKAPTGGCADEP